MSKIDMRSHFVWLDGDLMPFEQAKIDFLTPTLHYGMGVFAGMRCYSTNSGPAVLRLEAHLSFFLRSIQALGFTDLTFDVTDLRVAVHQTITANGFDECYVRPLMYLKGGLSLDMSDAIPQFGIATWRWNNYWDQEVIERGVRMMTSAYTRSHTTTSMFPSKMTGNYVAPMMAKTLARKSGFDEAIMLDSRGYVADCTGENLFMVRDGVIYTPKQSSHFGGITRDALITLAHDEGIEVREVTLSRGQMYVADEVFLCGTAAEVVHVSEVDHRPISNRTIGSITQKLQHLYFETARGRGKRSAEWLNYVGNQPWL